MPEDFEQQLAKLKDELTKLHAEVNELRARLSRLEEERAQHAADSLQDSF